MKTIIKLNEEYNGLKLIQINDGIVLTQWRLVENGEYCLDYPDYNTIHKWNMVGMHEGKSVWTYVILFATSNLNLEGVPVIEVKENLVAKIEKLGKEISELSLTSDDKFWVGKLAGIGEVLQIIKKSEAQQTLFTEEQVREAMDKTYGWMVPSTGNGMIGNQRPSNLEDLKTLFIESLKQPKVEITFDENNNPIKATLCD